MWVVPLRDKLSAEQWDAWQQIQRAALELVRHGDPEDPWLFHGTAAIQAGWVLRDGFQPQHLFGALDKGLPQNEGVYWGDPAIAAAFATSTADGDNLPLLFAARASAIARSTPDGLLRPDYFAFEQGCPRSYPEGMDYNSPELPSYALPDVGREDMLPRNAEDIPVPETWQQSLAFCGAVTAPGGRHVPELAMLNISADLPHHPDAGRSRARRMLETHPLWTAKAGGQLAPGMEMSLDPQDATGARAVLDMDQVLAMLHGPGLAMSPLRR